MAGIFVTGTGTNIGKTVVAAALLHRYRHAIPIHYWKPRADRSSGRRRYGDPSKGWVPATTRRSACREFVYRDLSPRIFPLSFVASELRFSEIVRLSKVSDTRPRGWLREGAGGVLVPLNAKESVADLMVALRLPAVIVASSQLGTINHTLLTLEALRKRSIVVAGVILNGDFNPENRRAIETFGSVSVLGEMPRFARLAPAALARWSRGKLDREGLLMPFLQGQGPNE
jgi:malonyl-CoA O-methyltransferase